MKVFRNLAEIDIAEPTAVTVGTFDGLHLGHQKVLQALSRKAKEKGYLEVLVTFYPHPQLVVGPKHGKKIELLTTLEEKLEILEKLGVPAVLVIPFDREFARTPYREFVTRILREKLHVKAMVIGYDHAFGRNREGNPETLRKLGQELGFEVEVVEPYYLDGLAVSSTQIRRFLQKGQIEMANKMLGRPYSLRGKVVQGKGRGRELGFPTANIRLNHPDRLIPRPGVYAVDVRLRGERYRGMMNIGHRPTFNFDPLTLEIHIINFRGSIYGEELIVEFKKFIREERKFQSLAELKKQLLADKEICENI